MQRPQNAKALHRFTAITIALALTGCGGEPNVDSSNAQIGGGTVELTVNRPPTIGGIPPVQVTLGNLYSFTPTANDPDGDVLSFEIDGLPVWANFDPGDGRLWGIPGSSDGGVYPEIKISASDGVDQATLSSFVITVNSFSNQAPAISGNPPGQVAIGGLYSFVPTADDPDGDILVFTITGEPAWANFDSATGRLWGEPGVADAGTHSGIQINVTDGNDSAALPAFAITIVAQALGTVTISWTAPTENDDDTPLTDLAGFKVYIGTSAGHLPRVERISTPGASTYLIENLTPGTWFYAMTAFNTSETESIKSDVVSWTYVP
jgi:hypothetical protein